jgi:hypothetical protein
VEGRRRDGEIEEALRWRCVLEGDDPQLDVGTECVGEIGGERRVGLGGDERVRAELEQSACRLPGARPYVEDRCSRREAASLDENVVNAVGVS